MPEEQRKRLIRQYARFLKQIAHRARAMADYFAGQRFFDFYPGEPEEDGPRSSGTTRHRRKGARTPRVTRLPLDRTVFGPGKIPLSLIVRVN